METVPENFFGEVEEMIPVEDFVEQRERERTKYSGRPEEKTRSTSDTSVSRKRTVSPRRSSSVKRVKREPEVVKGRTDVRSKVSEDEMNDLVERMKRLSLSDGSKEREEQRQERQMSPPGEYLYYRVRKREKSNDSERDYDYDSEKPKFYRRYASPPSPHFYRRVRM